MGLVKRKLEKMTRRGSWFPQTWVADQRDPATVIRRESVPAGLFGTRFSLMSLSSSTDDVNSIRSRSSMALNLPQVAEFLNDDDLAQVIDRAKKQTKEVEKLALAGGTDGLLA